MNTYRKIASTTATLLLLFLTLGLPTLATAATTLTVTPKTWDILGLDSNNPATGPNHYPVGATVCSSGATSGNLTVALVWDTASSYIALTPGNPSSLTFGPLAAGACVDAYFGIEINPVPAAFFQARRYHITATAAPVDGSATASTPIPRQLYVEKFVSQNRNGVKGLSFQPATGVFPPTLASFPAQSLGGSWDVQLGNSYDILVHSSTATGGYNQLENFIDLPGFIFQIESVSSTYTVHEGIPVPNPSVYADGCTWDPNPSSPSYSSCVGADNKVGGNDINTIYRVKVISGAGTAATLNAMTYDFSGSSFHYNADYTGASIRTNIVGPSFAKSFTAAAVGGTSTLSFTIKNPSSSAISSVSFSDSLPATPGAMAVATPAAYSTSGCGTPTFAPGAGATALSFSNGTIAAGATCTINVTVTVPAAGTYSNTSGTLSVAGTDTGLTAIASLTAAAAGGGAGICGLQMAQWTFGSTVVNPATPPLSADAGGTVSGGQVTWNTGTITGAIDIVGSDPINKTAYLSPFGWPKTQPAPPTSAANYIEFSLDAATYTGVQLQFLAEAQSSGPSNIDIYTSTDGTTWTALKSLSTAAAAPDKLTTGFLTYGPYSLTGNTNAGGKTYVRFYGWGANNRNQNADFDIDNVVFTGCGTAAKPTITASFSPNPVVVNGVSTLTFTLANSNSVPLTGAKFSDLLPAGLQVAAAPAYSTTCGGTPSWAPTAGATQLDFGQTTGGTIPASGSCTVTVNVTATTSGAHTNVSGFISSNQSGTNTTSTGSATASLTALLPPVITTSFGSSSILTGGTTTLTLTVSNPNPNDALGSVGFADNYPANLFNAPNPTFVVSRTCSGIVAALQGGTSISLSGETLPAGGSCWITVPVTSATAGTYTNSVPVSALIGGSTVTGNTASSTLTVSTPQAGIKLLKQTAAGAGGPWTTFLNVVPGNSVYYRFTVENTGQVPLSPVSVSDPRVAASGCTWPATLPVASPIDDPTATCTTAAVIAKAGDNPNTATASGTYGGTAYTSSASADYFGAAAGFSLLEEISTSATGPWSSAINVGTSTPLYYRFTFSNTGNVALNSVSVVGGSVSTASCTFTNPLPVGGATYCVVPITGSGAANTTVNNTVHGTGISAADGITAVNTLDSTASYTTSGNTALSLTKSHSGSFTQGQSGATYTVTVGNTGSGPTSGTLTVTDTLPTGLTFVSGTGTGWGCTATGQTVNCTSSTSIPAFSSGNPITLTVNVATNAAPSLTNVAIASGGGAPNTPSASDPTTIIQVPYLTLGMSHVGDFYRGETGIYTLTVGNTGSVATSGQITVTDTLPTGLTFNSWTGAGWTCSADTAQVVVTCTGSASIGIGGSGVPIALTVNVDPTLVGPVTNTATAQYGGAPNTATAADQTTITNNPSTPVTLSYFKASTGRVKGDVSFEWQTATEVGHLGFKLYVEDGLGGWLPVTDNLIPSDPGDSNEVRYYRYNAVGVQGRSFMITDLDILGTETWHGPFRLGQGHGVQDQRGERIDWQGIKREHDRQQDLHQQQDRGRMKKQLDENKMKIKLDNRSGWLQDAVMPWAKRLASGLAGLLIGTAQAGDLPVVDPGLVWLKVSEAGIYRVTYENLAANGLDLAGVNPAVIALTNRGVPVPITVESSATPPAGANFGPGWFIEFIGTPLDTLYTSANVYALRLDAASAARIGVDGTLAPSNAIPVPYYLDTVTVAKNALYSLSSPNGDPWYAASLLANGAAYQANFAITLDNYVGAVVPVTLDVGMWGGLDWPTGGPDHHIVITVNGAATPVADERFDGVVDHPVRATIPVGVVKNGANTITLRLPKDTGFAYDLVNLDRYGITYPRAFASRDGKGFTATAGGDVFEVSRLGSGAVRVYRKGSTGLVRVAGISSTLKTDLTYTIRFAGTVDPATYQIATAAGLKAPAIQPAPSVADITTGPASYLVIAHPNFIDANLDRLVQQRQAEGYTVKVVSTDAVYAQFDYGIWGASAIRDYIRYAYRNMGTRWVLLVGGDTMDYRNYLGFGAFSFLPSLYAQTDGALVRFAPVDPLYADADGDRVPDIGIGRFPVRTAAELKTVVDKTLLYGQPKAYARTAVFATDQYDAASAHDFRTDAESMIAELPLSWGSGISKAYVDDIGLGAAKGRLTQTINAGVALTSFVGHSAYAQWSLSQGGALLTAAEAAALTNVGRPTVVTQWGCWNSWYVSTSTQTMAHKFLVSGAQGAAAVLGATTLTQASHERTLGQLLFSSLMAPGLTIGEALTEAKQQYAGAAAADADVLLGWTLLGDPTLKMEP